MGFLGDIIGGITGLGQSAIEARTAKRNVDMTIDANRKMAEYQYSKDLEMWNRANAYNDPSAQMARYQSAGLNPNLIYGTGSASAGNTATTLPKYSAPTAEYNYNPPVDIATMLGMYQDFRLKQAQIDSVKEDVFRKNWENYYNFKATPGITLDDGTVVEPKIGIMGHKWNIAKSQASIMDVRAEYEKKRLSTSISAIDLQNEIREKTRSWFVANQLSNMVGKALAGLGISKLANRLAGAPRIYR